MNSLIDDFIKDLKIESVKLNLQLSCPNNERQANDMLGTLIDGDLDSTYAMTILRTAIKDLEAVNSITELQTIFNNWNETRIKIQYAGYTIPKRSEAYAYVFMMRVLKNHHTSLFKQIK